METFDRCVRAVLLEEGGLSDHPQDPGGLTKYGISRRAYPDLDIRRLTMDDVIEIYRRDYWNPVCGTDLPASLALLVFDSAVNQGVGTAARLLQKAVGVTADGSFTAHSGKTVNLKSNVDSSAICGASSIAARATLKGTGKGRTPSLVVRLSGKNAKLRMARITLPSSQLRLVKVKSKTATKGVVGGKTRKLVRSGKGGRTLTVKAPNAKGSSAIEIRLGKKALRKTSKLKPGKKFTLAIRYTQGASTKVVKTIKVRVTARK